MRHDALVVNNIFDIRRKRLSDWMRDKSLNQTDVATRTGKTRSYVSLLLSAGKSFGEKTARHFEQSLHMPSLYLDSVDDRGLQPVTVWESPEDLPHGMYALVPRVAIKISAGSGSLVSEETDLPPLAFREDWLRKKHITSRKNLRTCEVSGDSMEPYLEDGDTVLIDMGQTHLHDSHVYAIRYGDEIRIKRLFRRFDGGLIIRSDNTRYAEEQLDRDQAAQITVLGALVWRGG